eukprot:ANDGO_02440.mRNA.1 hypothetical protein
MAAMVHVVCSIVSFIASLAMYIHMKYLRFETRLFRYFVFARFFLCQIFFSIGGILIALLVLEGPVLGMPCSIQGGIYVSSKIGGCFTCYVTFWMIKNVLGDLSRIHLPYIRAGTVYNMAIGFGGLIGGMLTMVGFVGPTAAWCNVSEEPSAGLIRWVTVNLFILLSLVGILYSTYQIKMSSKIYSDYEEGGKKSEEGAEDDDDPWEEDNTAADDNEIPEIGKSADGPKLTPAEVHSELFLMLIPCTVWTLCMFIGIIYEYSIANPGPGKRTSTTKDTELFQNSNGYLMAYASVTALVGFFQFFIAAVLGMTLAKDKPVEYFKMKASSMLTADDLKEM